MTARSADGNGRYLSFFACIALCMLAPLSGLAQTGISPIMPEIAAHFADLPNAGLLVRLMVSGLAAAMILGALVSGFLAERYGQLRTLLACLLVFGLAGAAGYVLDNIYLIVASRFVLGLVNAAAGVLAMALLTMRVAPQARDRWLGFFIVSGNFGVTALMIVVGFVSHLGWRNVFLLYFIALPIGLLIALTFTADGETPPDANTEPVRGGGLPWQMMLLGLLLGSIGMAAVMYMPFYLAEIGDGSSEKVAPAMIVSTLTGGSTSFAYGWVRRWLSALQVFVVGSLICALGLFIVVLTADYQVILIGTAISGVGLGMFIPNLFAASAAATPAELRTRVLGFVRAGFYAGPLVVQPLLEIAMNRSGARSALLVVVAVCVTAAILSLIVRRSFAALPDESRDGANASNAVEPAATPG